MKEDIRLAKVDPNDLRPIREIVFQNLKKAILSGELKPGNRLVESTIAEKMEASRTPVREALRQLELEGLAVHIHRRGTVVKGISIEDALEIYEIREVLEGLVVRKACVRRTTEEIDELYTILNEIKSCIDKGNMEENLIQHKKFNMKVLDIAKSERLQNMMTNIYESLSILRNVSLESRDRQTTALEEHKKIVQAIENQQEELGEKLAREHIIKAKQAYLDHMKCRN